MMVPIRNHLHVFVAALIAFVCSLLLFKSTLIGSVESLPKGPVTIAYANVLPAHENCSLSFVPSGTANASAVKPLWMPNYPSAGGPPSAGNFNLLVRGLVAGLTGYPTGAKSFHVTSGTVKRCRSKDPNDVVVACSCLHPIVKLAPTPGERKDDFNAHAVLNIRNPRSSIPAYHNDKAIKYHDQHGQVSEDDWRKFRDQYLEVALGEWVEMVRYWTNSGYQMLFLDYDLLLSQSGYQYVEQFATVLREAGFETAASGDDYKCAWYKTVGPLLRQEEMFRNYVPSYTPAQKEYMVHTLLALVDELAGDGDLTQLVQMYLNDIRAQPMEDQPFNTTEVR
jgi:hypothetical protein